jgi:hypothetical protein
MYYKICFYPFWALLFIHSTHAQTYFTTGGIRLGTDYGLSIKQFIMKKTTVEMILSTEDNAKTNLGLSFLLDKHQPIVTRNFNLFYGAGLSVNWFYENHEKASQGRKLGVPVQVGLEFTVGKINLSWDYTPILYISTNSNAFDTLKGLSVRYVFINKKEGKRISKQIKSVFSNKKKKK